MQTCLHRIYYQTIVVTYVTHYALMHMLIPICTQCSLLTAIYLSVYLSICLYIYMQGTYRRTPVAIKLLFTPDLNPHVIRRCASEASILSQISRLGGDKFHANVVKIFGVSVLPPSVCIVLEICYYGSLSDVIRGVNYFKPGSSGGVTGRERESFRNSLSMIMAETGRSSFGSNHSGSALSLALEINPAASSGTGSGSPVVRPPLNLTLSDKYFLGMSGEDRLAG